MTGPENDFSRRDFLKTTAAGVAATSTFFIGNTGSTAAPSQTIRVGILGSGGRGQYLSEHFASFSDCEVAAICDVDPQRREKLAGKLGNGVQVEEDYRRILDNPDIDAIVVATPDHWHAPMGIAALLAGKHAYVEKPCCHNIREGQLLVEAAKQSGKCAQHGTQSRSSPDIIKAIQALRDGIVGKIRMAKAINHQLRTPIGRAPVTDPPAGVNYDLWTGPAPMKPFTKNRWHYNWHWFWDLGTGDLGNDGAHQVDVARWGLGVDLPNGVTASGGQLFYDDDHETPDTQVVTYEYDDCYLLFEMRLWTDYELENQENGVIYYGDGGSFEIGSKECHYTLIGEKRKRFGGGKDLPAHVRNFLDAVKADDPKKLSAPIADGFSSAALCHLGNIGTRVGRKLNLTKENVSFVGDPEASALLGREYREGYEPPKV